MASPGVSPRRSARVKVVALPSPPAVTHSASPQQMDARLADQPTLTRSPEAMSARSVRRPNRRKSMAAHAAQQPTRQSAVSPLAAHDLRPLEAYCLASVERCHELEKTVAQLERDIGSKLQLWDDRLAKLAAIDAHAQKLAGSMTASLASLRASATPQVSSARRAVLDSTAKIDDRAVELDSSISSIMRARHALERLEARLDDEESTLKRIDDWQRALAWLLIVVLAGFVALVAWLVQ
ncbi:hypothetical protein BMF94_5143 [Rhodotorula taiwanensis]|uniref:Uncharacterized protein n=1 Tax=Rhodotorula taiwanensis TaxID=741276 RepID=A0A2S5B4S7_9BASI|nr:hypothetical protein BMF94_5143 [Rhodotorula taiwanensis]